jgi:hypothetical protein
MLIQSETYSRAGKTVLSARKGIIFAGFSSSVVLWSRYRRDSLKTIRIMIWIFFLMCAAAFCHGQGMGLLLSGGSGVTNQPGDSHNSLHISAGFNVMMPMEGDNFPYGLLIELGYAGPAKKFSSGSAVLSANYTASFLTSSDLVPFLTAGYTRIAGTGNALNFGGGIDYLFTKVSARGIRFEVRDYMRISGARERDLAFKVGIISFLGVH